MVLTKKSLLFVFFSISLLLNPFVTNGKTISKDPCDEKYEQFNEVVLNDVKATFPKEIKLMLVNRGSFEPIRFSLTDLQNAMIAIGKKDPHLSSLQELFRGKVLGNKILYIFTGQPSTPKYNNSFMGYVLYKEIDGTNVLEIIRRGEKKWEVLEVKKARGSVIKFESDCSQLNS